MKKINLWYFLFLGITILIIFSWFSTDQIISNNSEENLDILNPSRTALHYSTVWWSVGTGTKIPFLIPREGAFFILSLIEKTGIQIFLIQAIFLGAIMFLGLTLMYMFVKYCLKHNNFVAGVSSLFYLLNIYSLTQVWKRFLYFSMIAWAYLPLFLFAWLKWIIEFRLKWLALFLLSSAIFSYIFAQPVYLLTFWVPAAILVLIRIWELRNDIKKLLKLIGLSTLGFILWAIVNIWWLYPTFFLTGSWTDENLPSLDINFSILTAVSKSFPLNELLLLRQSWYLGHGNDWFNFYHNPFIYLISIAILAVAIFGFIKLKGNKYRKYLAGLALVGLFVSKGSNFPLGYSFYLFLFSSVPFTTALRNSYEKFGLVWLLPYAVFFSYGLHWIFLRIKNRYKRIFFLSFTLFLSCGVLVYPFWNGDIFPLKHRVNVPYYYNEANNFLNSQNVEREFHIPFTKDPIKISFDWGYVGEDPMENLLDAENLASPNAPLYDKTQKILPDYLTNKNFPKILGILGAQYVILQRDIIYPEIDFTKTKKQIESWQGIGKVQSFDKLDLYSLDPAIIEPRIYTSGNVIRVNSLIEGWDLVTSDKWGGNSVFTLQDIGMELKNKQIPQVTFTKISTTQYKANVKGSNNPYILVFNNTYDPLWKVRIGSQIEAKHFIINGFANGWLLNKKGDYDIEIKLTVWPWD